MHQKLNSKVLSFNLDAIFLLQTLGIQQEAQVYIISRNEFFPAMQFRWIEYYIEMLEIDFAKQIAEFISTLRRDNVYTFNIYPGGDMSNPLYIEACNT
jgi:hypothetical protein